MKRRLSNSHSNTDLQFDRMISVLVVGLCSVVSSNIASVKSSVTVQSLVFIVGERVELKCSITGTDAVSWKYTSWNSSTETDIYLIKDIIAPMRSRYKIDKNITGQRNLIIDSVDLAHAGRYRCTGVQQLLKKDEQLIVLGSHPVCFGNTSEADVTTKDHISLHLSIWCSLNYTGNGFPVFSWTKSNSANATNSVTCQLSFTNTSLVIQQLQANDSGVTFSCLLTFQTPNSSKEKHIIVLEHTFTWNYSLYGPSNLSIVQHEDHLKCSAYGNPPPIYRWTNNEATISMDGPVYSLNLINDNEHTLYCTAENMFAHVRKNYTIRGRANDSNVTSDVPSSLIWLTTPAIAGSLPVLLIIIIIFACVVYRKRLKGETIVQPDVALNTDLTSYGSDGRMISGNAVYAEVCKPTGSDDGRMISDNAVYADVCTPKGSDGRMVSANAVYAEVCKPTGPSKGNKGSSIGDNSRSPQHPIRDHVGDDGTEYVNMGAAKSADRKGVKHVSDPPAFSKETIYTSIDHSGRVPRSPLPTKW